MFGRRITKICETNEYTLALADWESDDFYTYTYDLSHYEYTFDKDGFITSTSNLTYNSPFKYINARP